MSRKVFISFLGTNNYVLCKYAIEGVVSKPVRFVQEALIENLCKDWTETDRILIFCTSKESTGENGSKEINWFDNGQPKIVDESEKIGLQHRLQDLKDRSGLKPKVEQIDIEVGFSEEEIWNIFNVVYSNLQIDDQIYFDVTHAFRSIPLFSVVLFNYSKFMKGSKLESIMYGAFEKMGPVFKVRELPLDERVAPVINLTNIVRLQEYNQIASSLKEFGKVRHLKDALITGRESSSDSVIRNLAKSVSQLDEYIATIDLMELKKGTFISTFRNNYKNVKKRKGVENPIMNILEELNKETEEFVSQDDYKNIEVAINWTIKHDMLMQAYPLTAEYIILRVSDEFNYLKPPQLNRKQFRVFVSDLLGMPAESFKMRSWGSKLSDYPEVADMMADDSLIKELRSLYDPIRLSRNSLAHGNGSITYAQLKERIPNIICCIQYLNVDYASYPSTQYIKKCYGIH